MLLAILRASIKSQRFGDLSIALIGMTVDIGE
jgi:hypothetical protein